MVGQVFALAGLAGSGKSTGAEIIESELQDQFEHASRHEVSDFCRELYEERVGGDTNDNDLGRWTAELKEENGAGYIVREMSESLSDEDGHLAISGLRSPEEAAAVRDVFGTDSVTVVAVWTLTDIRFERKYGSTPHAEHPDFDTFEERNQREVWDWRCVDYFRNTEVSDYIVPNNGSLVAFEGNLRTITRIETGDLGEHCAMWDERPFPTDDAEAVAQYL